MTGLENGDPWALFGTGPRDLPLTLKRDGRPQLSNVGYLYDGPSRTALISVTDGRAKSHNLRRDPRASLHVTTPNPAPTSSTSLSSTTLSCKATTPTGRTSARRWCTSGDCCGYR